MGAMIDDDIYDSLAGIEFEDDMPCRMMHAGFLLGFAERLKRGEEASESDAIWLQRAAKMLLAYAGTTIEQLYPEKQN